MRGYGFLILLINSIKVIQDKATIVTALFPAHNYYEPQRPLI